MCFRCINVSFKTNVQHRWIFTIMLRILHSSLTQISQQQKNWNSLTKR
jgi:hypothetical protein